MIRTANTTILKLSQRQGRLSSGREMRWYVLAIGYACGVLGAHGYTAGVSTMKFTKVLKNEFCAGIE